VTTFLVILLVVLLGGGGWLIVRQQAEHKKQSESRSAAMLAALQEHAAAVARSTATARSDSPAAPFRKRDALLTQRQNMFYLLLKTGLPEHVIFGNLRLAELVVVEAALPAGEREQRLRLLERLRVEFVVCDRTLQPLAAVSLDGIETEVQRIGEYLQAAGIRYLSLTGDNLPKREELRSRILG